MSDALSRSPGFGGFSATLNQDQWDFADLILKTRFARALSEGLVGYPIYRSLRFAARGTLESLFDELALGLGWNAQRLDSHSLILDADGLFVVARGTRKTEY